jgi:uncharacterized membrane protein
VRPCLFVDLYSPACTNRRGFLNSFPQKEHFKFEWLLTEPELVDLHISAAVTTTPKMLFYRLSIFLTTYLTNDNHLVLGSQMNVHLAIHMKGFVISPVMGKRIIVITLLCAATLFFVSNFGAKAYAQENNNTLILEDIRAILRDQQRDISSVSNMTPAQLETLNEINDSSTKLATQGAYTALSVFFLGIGLVIFGLRMTTKGSSKIGRRFTLMVWALTLPVIILVGIFQYGEITGNTQLAFFESEEPYFILSFLLYIPIGILLFLLFEQKAIVAAEAEDTARQKKGDRIQEIEKLVELKERGVITEEEFQKLKTESLAKL